MHKRKCIPIEVIQHLFANTVGHYDAVLFAYSLIVLRSYSVFLVLLALLSFLLDIFSASVLFELFPFSLRTNMGGFHFKNKYTCLLFSLVNALICGAGSNYLELHPFTLLMVYAVIFTSLYKYKAVTFKNIILSKSEKTY
ncbi:hypothetical protein A4S06_04920 [Erysipelotrichaceae bacterium MTC7]|nr:hypothetical protein A4S06_04920 [Erysipelotrichaceae bacterium MTC7]